MQFNIFIPTAPAACSDQQLQFWRSEKLKFIMRVSVVYCALLIAGSQLLFASSGFGQPPGQRMTKIEMRGEGFQLLITRLKEQTGLSFVISGEVELNKTFNFRMADRTVKQVLDLALNETNFTYHFKDNTVFIYKRNTLKADIDDSPLVRPSTYNVTGKVIDAGDQEPLIGVSVFVKGTTRGTTSDALGTFALEAEEADVIVFSFIGFKTFETPVGKRTVIDVAMEEDMAMLRSVEVVGTTYSSTTKEKSTASIVKITSKEIERQPVTSPLMALQGRVPGLEVIPQTGGPGSAPKIRIRGNNSLRDDGGYPLYIVDGIVIESAPIVSENTTVLTGGADPLSTINPANIESIEVLKDADATAIYGSRGANGVIVIKTKQAKPDGVTSFDITAYTGVGQIANKIDLLNTQQYLNMRHEAFRNDNVAPDMNNAYDLLLWDTTRYTDWQKELLGGAARTSDFQSVLTGGSKTTSFRFGSGYHKETLIFPGDFNYQRVTGSLNLNHASSDKKFRISINLNYGYERNKLFSDLGIIIDALTLPPNAPSLYDQQGHLNWAPKPDGFSTFSNPLASLKKEDRSTTGNLVSNVVLAYELVAGLHAKTNIGFTDLHSDEVTITPISASAPEFRTTELGRSTFIDNDRSSWVIEPQLSYDKETLNHSLSIVVGSTIQNSNRKYQAIYAEGYTSDALLGSLVGAGTYTMYETLGVYRYLSLFMRTQYHYKDRYLLSLSLRRDGSSRFGPEKRFGNFYSIAPAWIFSEEPFVKDHLGFLSFGKLRASYGTTGNDRIGDYKFHSTFNFGTRYQNQASLVSSGLYNPDFAWEVTKKIEAAAELGFSDNRISLEVGWYRNISSNQLVDYQLPSTTGFASVFSNFDATIENTGLEAILNTVNVSNDHLKWNTSLNISVPRNKLKAFRDIENSSYNKRYKVGESLSIQRLYIWEGIDPQTGAHRFADLSDNGLIDDNDKVFMNARDRKFYGGLLNTIQYKSFELSVLFQFSNQRLNRMQHRMPGQYYNQPVQTLSHWEKEGDVANAPRASQRFSGLPSDNPYADFGNAKTSSYSDEDASFVRLKTLSLSYLFPAKSLKVLGVKECRTFLQGQNLFTVTKYVNLDPETGSALPPLRMLTLGLNLKF